MKIFKNKVLILRRIVIAVTVLFATSVVLAQKEIVVDPFEKVIISPHIEVTFMEGTQESVTIHSSNEPLSKVTVEVVGSTLRLYLEGAKTYTDSKKIKGDHYDYKVPIYKGTVVKATVTYKNLKELSLRGAEKFICTSKIDQNEFTLKIFGESQVYFNEVQLGALSTTIYGESFLELKEGRVDNQKITAYGESKVNTLNVDCNDAKITAYGEGSYRLSVKDKLKVTAFGEATIAYEGSPEVKKGIVIGEATIQKMN